jgi:predicted outer membrane repeat protein
MLVCLLLILGASPASGQPIELPDDIPLAELSGEPVARQPAATVVVDKLGDGDDGDTGPGQTTLREALALAQDGDAITFDPALAGQTIVLTDTLFVDKSITLDGGQAITLSGDSQNTPLYVDAFASLTVIITGVTVADGYTPFGGGGLAIGTGHVVTVSHSAFLDNAADAEGGAIRNFGTLYLAYTTLARNQAGGGSGGGALYNAGVVVARHTTFYSNTSQNYGGAIHNDGTLTLENSTLSANVAASGGGGILNNAACNVTLDHVTLAGNGATSGGALDNWGSLTMHNSLLADSTSGGDCVNEAGGVIDDNIHNLVEDGGCNSGTSVTGFVSQDPVLGPLQDNGGPATSLGHATWTHALLDGSPAREAGDTATCLPTDQRDVSRPQGTLCDTGAFEAAPTPPSTCAVYPSTDTPLALLDPGTVTSTLTVSDVFTITDVNITLNISHSYDSDVTIDLIRDGHVVGTLLFGLGGDGDNFSNTILDDEAATSIWDGVAPFTGRFQPMQALNVLDGGPSNGEWGLAVSDSMAPDSGTLLGWELELCPGPSVGDDAPTFTSTPITAATQDAPYTYTVTTADPNSHPLTLTAPFETRPGWLDFTDLGGGSGVLYGTPDKYAVGDFGVTLYVSNSLGLTTTQSFTVTVANVNDAPIFISTPPLNQVSHLTYTYSISTTDVDGDPLTLSAPTLPGWANFAAVGNGDGVISGTPTFADIGQSLIGLRLADSWGAGAWQTFTLMVENDPPTVNAGGQRG